VTTMKAISLWQPWASAIALGIKTVETRSWQTWYAGPIAIHAAQKRSPELHRTFEELLEIDEIRFAFEDGLELDYNSLPFGEVIATARLTDCVPAHRITNLSDAEVALGDFSQGRFGWMLTDIKRLEITIPARGFQRLFNVEIP